jgi:hypothetical protein
MIGLITGFLLVGCISAKIGYKYYGIDAESYGGHLLGPKPSDDILFSVCKPDDQVKGKCVVLLVDEFQAMATELIQLRAALKDCQKQCAVNH